MTPLHHAYLLKGWLLDKSPPEEVTEALEAIIGAIRDTIADVTRLVQIDSDVTVLKGNAATFIASRGTEVAQPNIAPAEPECPPAEPESADVPVADKTKPRRQSNMSPEARAAAAERMRAYQAKKKAEREAASHGNESAPAHREPEQPQFEIRRATKVAPSPTPSQQEAKPKPLPPIDPERLITVHKGYAGKREDGTLTDGDWPDIKARLARREESKAIASDYEVSEEDFDFFIASCQRREGKLPGEALAPPSSVASGATQRRT